MQTLELTRNDNPKKGPDNMNLRPCLLTTLALCASIARASWVYTETNATETAVAAGTANGKGTLTDGVWTFGAVRTKGTHNLAVDCSRGTFAGTQPSPIDFSTGVTDGDATPCAVTSFTKFSAGKSGNMYAYKDMLTAFIAPDCKTLGTHGVGYDFALCTKLTTVVLNDAVFINKGGYIFSGCTSLAAFSPRSLKVGDCGGLFSGCSSLDEMFEFPDLTVIPVHMFDGCSQIEEVKAPKATAINEYAFRNCTSLTNVASAAITAIGRGAFQGCTSIDKNFVYGLLDADLRRLGNVKTDERSYVFYGCTGISGEFVWNLPQLDTNIVPAYCFAYCTGISRVLFKTPAHSIYGYAFLDMGPGAELYVPADPPTYFGPNAIAATAIKGNKDPLPTPVNYPKVYLSANIDEWLAVMDVQHCLFPKSEFNNQSWSGTDAMYSTAHSWSQITTMMAADSAMCRKDSSGITVYDNKVLAFLYYRNRDQRTHYGCWVLRAPVTGTKIMVQ